MRHLAAISKMLLFLAVGPAVTLAVVYLLLGDGWTGMDA